MKYLPILRRVNLIWMVCGLFLLTACATTEVSKERLEDRAMGRWDALLSGDLAAAYEYLSPGIRSSVSSLQYQRSIVAQKVRWTSAEYVESECEETICSVTILLGFSVYGALPGVKSFDDTDNVSESWLLVDGVWYFVPGS